MAKILYIHQYFNTLNMSGGTRSYELARRMVASGNQVLMLTSDRSKKFGLPRRENIEGIEVVWVPCAYHNSYGPLRKMLSFIIFSFATCWYAIFLNYSMIFATSTPLTVGIPALLAKKIRRKPYIFEVRDLWPEMPIAVGAINNKRLIRFLKWLEARIYVNSDALIGLSPGMSEGISDVLAEHDADIPVYTAPNSCDFDKMSSPLDPDYTERRSSIREKLNATENQKVILYAGTFGLLNDVEYLLNIAQKTVDNKDILYVIVGGGINSGKIAQFVESNNLKNVCVKGRVPKAEIVDYFAACDVGLSLFVNIPEMEKNSANKFFDTLASGKPIVLNYGGWQAEFIEKNKVGKTLSRDVDLAHEQLIGFLNSLEVITPEKVLSAAQLYSRQNVYETIEMAITAVEQQA